MADTNVTESQNQDATNDGAKKTVAAPTPAAMKAHTPSPAALAKKPASHAPATTAHSEEDIKKAESFGLLDVFFAVCGGCRRVRSRLLRKGRR